MALTDFDLVLFGGGGIVDAQLIPAMYARDRAGDLPAAAQIICIGRPELDRCRIRHCTE